MPREGQNFHRLVEHLQRAVAGSEKVTIDSPKYLTDKITGDEREHDIVLTYHMSQWDIVVAIECRDRSRRVGVNQVEEFYAKCRDTGVDRGIIVASGGFTSTARAKARFYGIDCFTMAQIEEVEWCVQRVIVIRRRDPTHTNVSYGIPIALQGKRFALFGKTSDGEDIEFDLERPAKLVDMLWRQLPDSGEDLEGTEHIFIENTDEFYLLDEDGVEHPIGFLKFDIDYRAVETISPLTFYRFGSEPEHPLFETLISGTEDFGDISGRVMLIRDADDGLRLLFMQEAQDE